MSATLFAMGCWLVCIRSERCGGAEMTMWRDEAEAVCVAPEQPAPELRSRPGHHRRALWAVLVASPAGAQGGS
jgi:hypothetical protein